MRMDRRLCLSRDAMKSVSFLILFAHRQVFQVAETAPPAKAKRMHEEVNR